MFKITENTNDKVVVSCEIPPKKYGTDKDVHVDLSNIISYVSEQNVKLGDGKWVKSATLYNYTSSPSLTGEFIYIKNKKETVKKSLIKQVISDTINSDIKVETENNRRKRVRRSAKTSTNSEPIIVPTESTED